MAARLYALDTDAEGYYTQDAQDVIFDELG